MMDAGTLHTIIISSSGLKRRPVVSYLLTWSCCVSGGRLGSCLWSQLVWPNAFATACWARCLLIMTNNGGCALCFITSKLQIQDTAAPWPLLQQAWDQPGLVRACLLRVGMGMWWQVCTEGHTTTSRPCCCVLLLHSLSVSQAVMLPAWREGASLTPPAPCGGRLEAQLGFVHQLVIFWPARELWDVLCIEWRCNKLQGICCSSDCCCACLLQPASAYCASCISSCVTYTFVVCDGRAVVGCCVGDACAFVIQAGLSGVSLSALHSAGRPLDLLLFPAERSCVALLDRAAAHSVTASGKVCIRDCW